VVRTADSERATLYASASTSAAVNGTIPHMALVEVISPAPDGWYLVRWDTVQGFIPGDLLTAGTAPRRSGDAVDPAPTPTPAAVSTATADRVPTAPLAAGDIAVVNSESEAGVNVRESASSDAERITYLQDDAQVTIVEGPTTDDDDNDWYKVKGDDVEGWVRGDLLTRVAASSTTTTTADSDTVSDAGFSLPLTNYRFTQDYGCSNLGFYTYDPNWGCAVHDGVDFAAPQGTPLLAASDGTVVVAGWCNCGLGYYVEIDHGDGLHSIYGHMANQPSVKVGDQVSRGDQIGQVGSTGLSTGPHVHFMVREDGVTVDPKSYLPPINASTTNAN
jgi:murein DD-endopeptidase MepM/ murein hydrolase activator NlpD